MTLFLGKAYHHKGKEADEVMIFLIFFYLNESGGLKHRITEVELYTWFILITHAKRKLYLPMSINYQFELLNSYLIVEDNDNSTLSAISKSVIPSQDSPQLISYNSDDYYKITNKRQKVPWIISKLIGKGANNF